MRARTLRAVCVLTTTLLAAHAAAPPQPLVPSPPQPSLTDVFRRFAGEMGGVAGEMAAPFAPLGAHPPAGHAPPPPVAAFPWPASSPGAREEGPRPREGRAQAGLGGRRGRSGYDVMGDEGVNGRLLPRQWKPAQPVQSPPFPQPEQQGSSVAQPPTAVPRFTPDTLPESVVSDDTPLWAREAVAWVFNKVDAWKHGKDSAVQDAEEAPSMDWMSLADQAVAMVGAQDSEWWKLVKQGQQWDNLLENGKLAAAVKHTVDQRIDLAGGVPDALGPGNSVDDVIASITDQVKEMEEQGGGAD